MNLNALYKTLTKSDKKITDIKQCAVQLREPVWRKSETNNSALPRGEQVETLGPSSTGLFTVKPCSRTVKHLRAGAVMALTEMTATEQHSAINKDIKM